MNLKTILLFSLMLLFVSCGDRDSLKSVLRLSGENRSELEKVLTHYSSEPADNMKLEAGRFLIRNMPGHGSYADNVTMNYYKTIDSLYSNEPFYTKQPLLCLPDYHNTSGLTRMEDINHITAEFLIEHIDRMFDLWRAIPWSKDITFDIFCEYILPYRVGCEPLESLARIDYQVERIDSLLYPWREYVIDMLSFQSYVFTHTHKIDSWRYNLPAPVSDPNYLFDCIPRTYQNMLKNRYIGIPFSLDFSPHWPERNGRHYWGNIFDPSQKKLTSDENHNARYAKVYRITYSHNPIPQNNGRDHIPSLFRNPFNKDVTDFYANTVDISVKINSKSYNPDHAYLCVFNECAWQPVAWSKVQAGRAVFAKTGVRNVYLPVFYDQNETVSGGYPFILKSDGKIEEFVPDKANLISLSLKRKYTVNSKQLLWDPSPVGVMIKGASKETFEDSKLLHTVKMDESAPYFTIIFDTPKSFRFWTLEMPPGAPSADLAEIVFYDAEEHIIDMNNIDIQITQDGKPEYSKALFDRDVLTYAFLRKNLTVDFIRDITISRIDLTARNDDNNITPGNVYELFYRDKDEWVSLGIKTAEDNFVEYHQVPQGALYWLRNHTKGNEERIFSYENGKITFR